jgi:hypothetical protein
MHVLEDAVIELQRVFADIEVLDDVVSKIRSAEESVVAFSRDKRIAVTANQNGVSMASFSTYRRLLSHRARTALCEPS